MKKNYIAENGQVLNSFENAAATSRNLNNKKFE